MKKTKLVAVLINNDKCEELLVCKNLTETEINKYLNEIGEKKLQEAKEKKNLLDRVSLLEDKVSTLENEVKYLKGE